MIISYALYKKVKRLANDGWHSAKIAEQLNITESTVVEICLVPFSQLDKLIELDQLQKMPRTENSISPRDVMIIELRKKGKTLDEIGKLLGLTRERVRQIVKKVDPTVTTKELRHKKQHREISLVLKRNLEIHREISESWPKYKMMKFDQLAANFGISEHRLRKCLSKIQYVYLQANEESKNPEVWTIDQCLQSLKVAATYEFPLTVLKYRKLIESKEVKGPTTALIFAKFGSWIEACNRAGIEYGEAQRDYNRKWNDTELVKFVRRFLHSRKDGKWSIENYEIWREAPEISGPSVALLRLRLGTWSELRVLAIELEDADHDLSEFSGIEVK
jgi:DNA-binding CsgD family transcriptional regulator